MDPRATRVGLGDHMGDISGATSAAADTGGFGTLLCFACRALEDSTSSATDRTPSPGGTQDQLGPSGEAVATTVDVVLSACRW